MIGCAPIGSVVVGGLLVIAATSGGAISGTAAVTFEAKVINAYEAYLMAKCHQNLIQYLPLGDSSPSLVEDYSANGYDAAIAGSPTWGQAGIPKSALNCVRFDASGDYLKNDNGTAARTRAWPSFTIMAWVKRVGAGTTLSSGTGGAVGEPILTKGYGFSDSSPLNVNYFMAWNPTSAQIQNDYEETTGPNHPLHGLTTGLSNDRWYQVAFIRDSVNDVNYVYLNGKQDNSASVTQDPQQDATCHTGTGNAASDVPAWQAGWFNGYVGHVAIWDRALSAAEVKQLFIHGAGLMVHGSAPVSAAGESTLHNATPGGAIAGTAAVTFDGSSGLAGTGKLLGPSPSAFAGASTIIARGAAAGTAGIAIVQTATLAGRGRLETQGQGAQSTATATAAGSGALSGAAPATTAGQATLIATAQAAGTGSIQFGGQATASSDGAITGTAAVLVDGASILNGAGSLSGISAAILDGSGTLTGSAAISATCAVVVGGTAHVSGSNAISGTSAIAAGGTSSLAAKGQLIGTVTSISDGSATGELIGFVAGAAGISTDPTAILAALGRLETQGQGGQTSAAGSLAAIGRLETQGQGAQATATATLAGSGTLAGSAPVAWLGSATAASDGAIAGSAIVTLALNAVGRGQGRLSGTSPATVATVATAGGQASLEGAGAVIASPTATWRATWTAAGTSAFLAEATGTLSIHGAVPAGTPGPFTLESVSSSPALETSRSALLTSPAQSQLILS